MVKLPGPLLSLIFLATATAAGTATGTEDVAAAAATAVTSSPVSNVEGRVFGRFVVVWLENTDFDKSVGDREFFPPLSFPGVFFSWGLGIGWPFFFF